MDSHFVDEAILGEFVDALIKKKYPNDPADAHADTKEQAVKALDFQIIKAILGKLTEDEGTELAKVLEKDDSAAFEGFFKDHGIDLDETIKDAMAKFADDFMKGGENE